MVSFFRPPCGRPPDGQASERPLFVLVGAGGRKGGGVVLRKIHRPK